MLDASPPHEIDGTTQLLKSQACLMDSDVISNIMQSQITHLQNYIYIHLPITAEHVGSYEYNSSINQLANPANICRVTHRANMQPT